MNDLHKSKQLSSSTFFDTDFKSILERGKEEFEKKIEQKLQPYPNPSDFKRIRPLGKGSFGTVFLAKDSSGELKALKVLEKMQLLKAGQIEYMKNELNVLKAINYPFVISLECWFQDKCYVSFVTPYISGGELFLHLRIVGHFEERVTQFFTAQVVLAFEYLHFMGVIYRDLKLENILLDNTGYVKLIDFGFSKIVKTRTYSLCGTPEYLAPEIILNKGYGTSVDWWTFGVLVFELTAGVSPFHNKEQIKMFKSILNSKYSIPKTFSSELKDLVKKLLTRDLSHRYGNLKNGVDDIKNHKWFSGITWIALFNKQLEPPYTPNKLPEPRFDKSDISSNAISTDDSVFKEF